MLATKAEQSPGNDDELTHIVFHINWILPLICEYNARIVYVFKKGFILQSKGVHLNKIYHPPLSSTTWPLHFQFAFYAYDN